MGGGNPTALQSSIASLPLSTQMSWLELPKIFAGLGPDRIFDKNEPLVPNMTEVVTFEKPDGKGKGGQLVLKGPPDYEFSRHPC